MKARFPSSGLLQLVFVSTIFSSTSLAFFRPSFHPARKESHSIQEILPSGSRDDILSQALSQAFNSSFGYNPAYATALDIFSALESKPSCYRSAAASLVLDCSAIGENNVQGSGIRVAYAAQLAVCEFEATGINFPQECRDLNNRKFQEIKVMKCVKRLEGRPQWWTTLSNNIQNAAVMCSAVRYEVEKGMISLSWWTIIPLTMLYTDQILALHKNITRVQQSLFSTLDSSLAEVWESITTQKEFTGTWRRALDEVLGDLEEAKAEVTGALKAAEANATGVIRRFAKEVESTRKETQQAAGGLDQVATKNPKTKSKYLAYHTVSPFVGRAVNLKG